MKDGDITHCECGHDAIADGLGTGYGINADGSKTCYACVALVDARALRETGRLTGYLSLNGSKNINAVHSGLSGKFTNWPGTLSIPVYSVRKSRNNFGASRFDFWFDWEGSRYWGVNIGDNDIARVRRIKR